MPRPAHTLRRFGLSVLLGLGVSAAADAQPASRLDARLDRLAEVADLSADQTAALDAVATRYADAAPADLWAAASEVQSILTDAQVDALRQAVDARRGARGARGERRVRGGEMRRGRGARGARGQGRRGRRGGQVQSALTDEQRAALRAIRQESREAREALVERFRAGALSDDAFMAESRSLREEAARRAAAVVPAEVAERQAERSAQREAARVAREQALGLTTAQKDRLQALRLDRIRQAPDRPDLRPYLDADGQLDRAAMRELRRERAEAQREARDAHRQAVKDVLTDEQEDLLLLHRAVAGGRARGMRRGGRRGGLR